MVIYGIRIPVHVVTAGAPSSGHLADIRVTHEEYAPPVAQIHGIHPVAFHDTALVRDDLRSDYGVQPVYLYRDSSGVDCLVPGHEHYGNVHSLVVRYMCKRTFRGILPQSDTVLPVLVRYLITVENNIFYQFPGQENSICTRCVLRLHCRVPERIVKRVVQRSVFSSRAGTHCNCCRDAERQ